MFSRSAILASAVISVPVISATSASAAFIPDGSSREPVTATAIAVGIGVGVAGGIIVNFIWDQATSKYVAVAVGYATPQPDASVSVKPGRHNFALATDADIDATGNSHIGQASAEAGIIFDDLDPVANSSGSYFNIARIYKNGNINNEATGGALPPGSNGLSVNVNMNSIPVGVDSYSVNVTGGVLNASPGGRGVSHDVKYTGGARYNGSSRLWEPFAPPATSTGDPTLDGAYQLVEGDIPSIAELAQEAAADGAMDISSAIVSALNLALPEADGEFLTPMSLSIPFASPVNPFDSSGNPLEWFNSSMAQASASGPGVPEPSMAFTLGAALLSARRRRR